VKDHDKAADDAQLAQEEIEIKDETVLNDCYEGKTCDSLFWNLHTIL
jgi:hypothetical protein